jgi:hypothetical protein
VYSSSNWSPSSSARGVALTQAATGREKPSILRNGREPRPVRGRATPLREPRTVGNIIQQRPAPIQPRTKGAGQLDGNAPDCLLATIQVGLSKTIQRPAGKS